MRMKFEAEDPSEVKKTDTNGVDRSQGAARAISVSIISTRFSATIHTFSIRFVVFYWPGT